MDAASLSRRRKVLEDLSDYITYTLATSTHKQNSKADRLVVVDNAYLEDFQRDSGITMLPPLASSQWKNFCIGIPPLQPEKSESLGTHPTLYKILTKLIALTECPLVLKHEQSFEDVQMKRPDFTLMMSDDGTSYFIEDSLLPNEAKIYDEDSISRALHQSLGYQCSRLRNLLDIHGFVDMHGFCVGFDGKSVSIGKVSIIDCVFKVIMADIVGFELWSTGPTPPAAETEGIRILRSLLSCTSETLGYLPPPTTPFSTGHPYVLKNVLGRGAFCTAFSATYPGGECVIKWATLSRCGIFDSHIHTETEVLRAFAGVANDHLPHLVDSTAVLSNFIAMSPLGCPLEELHVRKNQRLRDSKILIAHVNSALQAALAVGYCHRDVRPHNVVLHGSNYVLIDWGLAALPGTFMHKHRGGRPYYTLDLLEAERSRTLTSTPYGPEHDRAAVSFIAMAYYNNFHLKPPDWFKGKESLLRERPQHMADFESLLGDV